ncbi:MAG: phosphate regulon sensor histidine kinase PhoR [Woeseiaceae bacterium]
MPASWRKLLLGLLFLLGGGAGVGALYGHAEWGLMIAALLGLAWQIRQLLTFDRAVRTGDFDAFRYGEGLWEQLFARFNYQHERGDRRKDDYRRLLKEIRKSTNAMPDGAVIIDENHEIVNCNKASKELAGLKRKKDRGQRIDNIIRDPALTKLLESEDQTHAIDIPSPVTDGGWLNVRVVPYGVDQRLVFLRDITERIRLHKMRRDFVANASHELRSPLTVISGYLDAIAEDAEIPADWTGPVEQMRTQAQRMSQLVSELLELSSLEGGSKASSDAIVDVAGLLAAARKSYSRDANLPAIELQLESRAQLRGEGSQIESVISNLLSNALRHTPGDGTVTLSWRSGTDGADLLVSDSGEGIAEEHIPRLTERFFRVDRGRSRDGGGIGLGLAIVKHVLSRHDAELFISSKPGEGATFCCHFPPSRVVVEEPIPLDRDVS